MTYGKTLPFELICCGTKGVKNSGASDDNTKKDNKWTTTSDDNAKKDDKWTITSDDNAKKDDKGCNAKLYAQRLNKKTQETFKKEGIKKYCKNCQEITLFKAKECKHSSN